MKAERSIDKEQLERLIEMYLQKKGERLTSPLRITGYTDNGRGEYEGNFSLGTIQFESEDVDD